MTKRSITYCLAMVVLLLMSAAQAQTTHPYGLEQMMIAADDEIPGVGRQLVERCIVDGCHQVGTYGLAVGVGEA